MPEEVLALAFQPGTAKKRCFVFNIFTFSFYLSHGCGEFGLKFWIRLEF